MGRLSYQYIRQDSWVKNSLRLVKFRLRSLLYSRNYKILNEICYQKDPAVASFLTEHAPLDLLHIKYACRAFSFKYGYECFNRDLELLHSQFPEIFSRKKVQICRLDSEFSLQLNCTPRMINEGLMSLSLEYGSTLIYEMNFSLIDGGLLITCLQGGASGEHIKELLKCFTKRYFGLRPISFMIFYAFVFAQKISAPAVFGVDDRYAISSFKRGKKRAGRVLNIHNLDAVFSENCETLRQLKGYKELAFVLTSIEQIPSHKRSMYKKRYAFLASLSEQNKGKFLERIPIRK